jgi:hypothetical protein
MVKFNIGDRVERIGRLTSEQQGIVTRILLDESGKEWLHQYEVEFAKSTSTFYASQLVLAKRISSGRIENSRAYELARR